MSDALRSDIELDAAVDAAVAELARENHALRSEVERLHRILGRIIEWRGESTTRIRTDADAFEAAREYLQRNAEVIGADTASAGLPG